ncbi:MAG: hypothetical protein AB1758_17300, partial [Candidatus Eremiobacterota bacterium]
TPPPRVEDLFRHPPPEPPAALLVDRRKRTRNRLAATAAGALMGGAAVLLGPGTGDLPAAAIVMVPSMVTSMKGVMRAVYWMDAKTANLPNAAKMAVMCGSISVLALAGFAGMVAPAVLVTKALPYVPKNALTVVAGVLVGGALGLASANLLQNLNGGSQLEADYRAALQHWQRDSLHSEPAGTSLQENDRSVVVGGVRLPKKTREED